MTEQKKYTTIVIEGHFPICAEMSLDKVKVLSAGHENIMAKHAAIIEYLEENMTGYDDDPCTVILEKIQELELT